MFFTSSFIQGLSHSASDIYLINPEQSLFCSVHSDCPVPASSCEPLEDLGSA